MAFSLLVISISMCVPFHRYSRALGQERLRQHPKRHPIPYLVYYFRPGPIRYMPVLHVNNETSYMKFFPSIFLYFSQYTSGTGDQNKQMQLGPTFKATCNFSVQLQMMQVHSVIPRWTLLSEPPTESNNSFLRFLNA